MPAGVPAGVVQSAHRPVQPREHVHSGRPGGQLLRVPAQDVAPEGQAGRALIAPAQQSATIGSSLFRDSRAQ